MPRSLVAQDRAKVFFRYEATYAMTEAARPSATVVLWVRSSSTWLRELPTT
ncbi:hypothetical protein [Streptomyces sp. CB01635]|uniref:hypothetical protein n=2 Tax=unclassified Streptomyces TaxID=2593676 RepID=UPI001F284E53|nr:hypothetical protein [Streptomyces sp. CB01635]